MWIYTRPRLRASSQALTIHAANNSGMVYITEWYVTRGRHFCYSERTDITRGYTCVPSSSSCASLWGDVSLGALLRPDPATAGIMRGWDYCSPVATRVAGTQKRPSRVTSSGPWPRGSALHSAFTLNDSAVIGEVSRTVDPVRKRGGPVGDAEDGDVSALTIKAFQQRGRRCVPKRYSKERTGEWGLE